MDPSEQGGLGDVSAGGPSGGGGNAKDRAGAALPKEAQVAQKRLKAAECGDVSLDALLFIFTVMAQNHMLPKEAWSLCKLMHHKVKPFAHMILEGLWSPATAAEVFASRIVVHVELRGSLDFDPLLAMALSSKAPATGATDRFDALFRDVALITLRDHASGAFTRIPHALQALRIVGGDLAQTTPLLRALLRATDSGFQRDALTLVKSMSCDTETKGLPYCIGDMPALTELDLSNCTEIDSLPDSIGDLTALTMLDLSNCSSLVSLPDSIGNLSALKDLRIGCEQLTSLPDTFGCGWSSSSYPGAFSWQGCQCGSVTCQLSES
eukprot:TRINITY_DN270_c0_g3_i1.p1 TRINITY_DN270_c0_g3~~TRINITY_DN270_c0_g3_i1.p1  ORF type:complete len:323 (+),score=45.71 TRINITY_DN270_c0_g3_i1:190-1158(+)